LRRAVFIDRDGVVNRNVVRDGKLCAPRTLREFRLQPGVKQAITELRKAGFATVIVTNQPDIGDGFVGPEIVAQMHDRLHQALALDAIEMCPHSQNAGCPCRKPKPGMLTSAASRLAIDLSSSFMIGDRWSDIAAGRSAGCYTILVRRGPGDHQPTKPDAVVASMRAAIRKILILSAEGDRHEPIG
jgi:D-glycero-D-manno-heptose 1,7-bisphosphate phosphatase